jgi:predicted nucleic acid-binding protein
METTSSCEVFERDKVSRTAVKTLSPSPRAITVFDKLRSQKVRVATIDLRIASIAISRGLVLLTRHARDFSKIEDWTI